MTQRYVILHHVSAADEHWDLMLEQGEVLLTWRLERDPTVAAGQPIRAQRIADHPKRFLTYEGPLRHAPGSVRRVDAGNCVFHETGPDRYVFSPSGGRLSGCLLLERGPGDAWTLGRVTQP